MKNMFLKIYGLMVLLISSVSLYGSNVVAEIEYFYSDDGTLMGKAFNGKRVNFEYDLRGQLLAVTDASGKDLERYTYDPAGNRLSKTINGVTTTYSYDEANQLIRSTVNGEITYYEYDAAGRMIQAGDKSYIYNGNNKVSEVRQNGETIAKFEYNIDGQIAKAIYGDKKEEFIWDGLALIWRSGVTYINEPYVTGGNPVMAGDDVLFNDMLGSTLAVNDKAVEMTSFGETDNENAFFTGKPMIEELGYSFLFRDYNPNQGKWTTSDPLGYPDGWNNLAYCNNKSIWSVDYQGLSIQSIIGIFHLSTGILDIGAWVDGTLTESNKIILKAFSGNGDHKNKASSEWIQGQGPLPLGEWYIMEDLDKNDWWELWWKGDSRLDDTAKNPNGNEERRGIRLHAGNRSDGCITVEKDQDGWNTLVQWLQSMEPAFELTDYEDGSLIFHGKRKGYGIINVLE